MESKATPKSAQLVEAESASYWARIHRCPWRKLDFYRQMVRAVRDGVYPEIKHSQQKKRFREWADEFAWDAAKERIILVTRVPFPRRVHLPNRPERTFIVVPTKLVPQLVEDAYQVQTVGYAGAERLFHQLRETYLNVRRQDVYATPRRFKSRILKAAPEANPMVQPRVLQRTCEEWQMDLIDVGGQAKKTALQAKAPPTKLTRENDGWRYILTVQDTFFQIFSDGVLVAPQSDGDHGQPAARVHVSIWGARDTSF